MQRLPNIDPLTPGRPIPSDTQRQRQQQAQWQQARTAGYDQLTELCRLGEIDLAQQLAKRYPQWGYQIVDGIVREQDYPSES